MSDPITLPFWLLSLILVFAGASFLSHFLFPSVRWFFRRRMERAVERLNQRLERPIQPFKLMRRKDMIIRLIYDPQVMEAVVEYARENNVPESVAFQCARSYAREIVPAFSAATYFGFAIRVTRRLSRALYKVRLAQHDDLPIRDIDKKASVVFVMNHRSNMDYVLVTWLAAQRSAISYAVGEWARIWPLQALIRSMGAYFIRRRYLSPLYRRVLARYVQMATHEGVTQAIFPEGGLSLDGGVGPGKKGLLHYIVSDFQLDDGRDVVFIPVGLNYDRVLEDRVLIAAAANKERRFRVRGSAIFGFIARHLWNRVRGRFQSFGYAAVCYGRPISLEHYLRATPAATTDDLAATLMAAITATVPVLPVPLVAAALSGAPASDRAALDATAEDLVTQLRARGVRLHLPDGNIAQAVTAGLETLLLRKLVIADGDTLRIAKGEDAIVAFYAKSVQQHLDRIQPATAPEPTVCLTLQSPTET
ncbi:1-acyl-sn-glycerol-3-phosphate acyltransferase [Roseicitreum antarcticum]|nr:1-acyl-sn-glycerol-3-phosphate acyltransferase [Roseicitreum antarcticum]